MAASTSNCSEKVSELRTAFLTKHGLQDKGDDLKSPLFDDRDLKKVQASDVFLENYLKSRGMDVTKAQDMLETSLKWRKEFGVNDIRSRTFPREVWEMGPMYFHNVDKDGDRILYFNNKVHKKGDAQLALGTRKFIIHWFERHRRQYPQAKIVLMFDMTGCGLSQMDLDLIKFIINCFQSYYPQLLSYLLVYEIPWVLNAGWKIVRSWLSKEAQSFVKFSTKKDVQQLINKDQLMTHMGGTDSYRYRPEDHEEDEFADVSVFNEDSEKKKVTFSEPSGGAAQPAADAPAEDLKSLVDSVTDTPAPQTNGVANEDAKPKAYVSVSPNELQFGEESESTAVTIKLTNTYSTNISYKVKTTSPENYRVKPSLGVIKPGGSADVSVSLQQGHLQYVPRDKFLIMTAPVGIESLPTARLAQHWKTIPKNTVIETKLRCVIVSDGERVPGSILKHKSSFEASDDVKMLTTKLEGVTSEIGQLRGWVKLQTYLLLLMLVLLLLVITWQVFLSPAPPPVAANTCSWTPPDGIPISAQA